MTSPIHAEAAGEGEVIHELEISTYSLRKGQTGTKKLTVKQSGENALLLHERELKLDRVYVDLELKFDKKGKLTAVLLRESMRPML